MMWNYSKLIISEEDYYRNSRPKKVFCVFGLSWVGTAAFLKFKYSENPEIIMKRFLTTFWSPLFVITPFIAVSCYMKW